MKKIYITHCSRDKDDELERSGAAVTPDRLYTSPTLLNFISYCKTNGLDWAIFSDHYGVVFPQETITWYSKPPSEVTEEEFTGLLQSFVTRLAGYEEIHFLHRQGETHPLFQRVVELGKEAGLNIVEFPEENIKD
jgi:hypothetical protein